MAPLLPSMHQLPWLSPRLPTFTPALPALFPTYDLTYSILKEEFRPFFYLWLCCMPLAHSFHNGQFFYFFLLVNTFFFMYTLLPPLDCLGEWVTRWFARVPGIVASCIPWLLANRLLPKSHVCREREELLEFIGDVGGEKPNKFLVFNSCSVPPTPDNISEFWQLLSLSLHTVTLQNK